METFDLSEPERASLSLRFWLLSSTYLLAHVDKMLALLGDHLFCFLFWELSLERMLENMHSQVVIDTNIDDC